MKKSRLLILAGLLFIANAAQATKVCWVDHTGRLLYQWNFADGLGDVFVSESYYDCIAELNYLTKQKSKK